MRAEGKDRRDTMHICGKGRWNAKKTKSREMPKMNLPDVQVCLGTDPHPLIVTDGSYLIELLFQQ